MYERNYRPAGLDLNNPVNYSILDDYDILASGHGDSDVKSIVDRIKHRDLPKRALVITYSCSNEKESNQYFFATMTSKDYADIERAVERELRLRPGDVMFDIPDEPRLGGTGIAMIELAPNRRQKLQEIYPAGAWAKAYAGYRRVAYLFTTHQDRKQVGMKAKDILASTLYNINLNEYSLVLAKL